METHATTIAAAINAAAEDGFTVLILKDRSVYRLVIAESPRAAYFGDGITIVEGEV